MIIVTNRIKVKKGMGAVMAPGFTAPGPLDSTKGIVKVEVLLTQNLPDYDELNVNMYWETQEDFTTWRNSDAFKAAHKRPEPSSDETPKESPIIGSEIITYDIAATKEITK
ncbi:heme oxygenase (staphylobilin-producing) [Paenibacillus sp. DS2015]|uniref:heme oxygenase n=1 Tax=Paenibacillus sp. DS2015 TaxID=3373917 RepID=UPI003D213C6D